MTSRIERLEAALRVARQELARRVIDLDTQSKECAAVLCEIRGLVSEIKSEDSIDGMPRKWEEE
jgi:hypothetical protein